MIREYRIFCRKVATTAALLLLTANVLAHIKNEATQFPDIEFSDSRFDIVVLVGAGIIPETPVFEPDKNLSNADFAAWAALAEGLLRGGETPDVEALATAALDNGIVESLDGDATLGQLNRVFFSGQLDVDDPLRTPSKAEAATFVANALNTEAGRPLLAKRGLSSGATGEVTSVVITEGHHGNAYVMTVGGTARAMDEHGRVANGPTDLLQWQGRVIRRSFERGIGDKAKWLYLEAEPRQLATAGTSEAAPPVIGETPAINTEPAAPESNRKLLYLLLGAALILALVLFFNRRKST